MRWSLDELYTSFDSEEFKKDMEELGTRIQSIRKWSDKNLGDMNNVKTKIEEYINIQNDFGTLISRLYSFAHLTIAVDAKNHRALQIMDKLQRMENELTQPEVAFEKWLGQIENLEEVISSSGLLKEHAFYLGQTALKTKYLLSEAEEVVISKMKNTGSSAWAKLQGLLSSTLMVDININGIEKQLPLTVVRNMAFDGDTMVRKTAYEAELKAYEKIAESSAACLNGIKGEVITLSRMRGYKSPLEQTLIKSRMDFETLDAMFSAIKESLPMFHKYFRKKAELLGHKNGLPFYDLFAPMGNANMSFSYEEARDYIVKNFKSFSDKLSKFADNAFEKRWIDAEPREGKRGGAFCSNLHCIKECRILANFSGSFDNMTTLAHELGHGYHDSCLNSQTHINSGSPLPVAETASIFAETIIINAALKDASRDEAFTILENDLSSAGQVIVDIYSRFLFESELFRRREEAALSVKELKEIMEEAQRQAYGDGLDPNFLHPYMWVNKPHYYYSEANFYNFPYAFGFLFVKGLYTEYMKRGDAFIAEYDKLLSSTGKNTVAEVGRLAGVDVHSIDFWRSSLKMVEQDIEKFIHM